MHNKIIQVTQKNDNKLLPYVVWVEFKNTHIATNYHKKYSYLYTHHKINQQWTPIVKIKRSFIVKDHGFTEYNFLSNKLQHAQYMLHKVQHIQKFMLTYKHLQSLLLRSGNTCTM